MQQKQRLFSAGDVIMRQGDMGTSAYIIESGRVEIIVESKNGEQQLVGTRGSGAMIGEMAIIDQSPRSATIKAVEECKLLEITKDNFEQRVENTDPVLRMAVQVILTRYRDVLQRAHITHSAVDVESIEMNYAHSADAVEALKIANDFETGLENGEISMHYQPIIDLQSEKILGFEALMRWEHPERGFVPPGQFISILEDSGLIVKASQWALNESLMALKRIENRAGYDGNLFMSVNFSSDDFSHDDFIDSVYETISKSDITPRQLHIEITERLLMGQPDKARETLEMCKKAGIDISIDDFGTGYSSLSYLHSFPISTLKIDRSFIMKMTENRGVREMVRSIVGLGKNLNMKLIAEGVETEEELKALKEMGCDMVQGYYFCKPLPEKDIITYAQDQL